ncbi:MAG: phosphate ABC transporter permease subunit PstC [Acidimicrobiia bacterium]|nr:phosphate ABC transporter permease subunit PstC [Acidimicrobiia bacterium]
MTQRANVVDLAGNPRRRRREQAIRWGFLAAGLSSILVSLGIVVTLTGEAVRFLSHIDLHLLWEDGWFPRRGEFDIRTLVVGTLLTTAVAMAVATPLGLGAAVYLAEYARPGVRKVLKPTLEVLAGIPSVVLGFFALTWISPEIVKRIWSDAEGFNLAAAGIGIGILVTPLVASIAEDAMRAVPRSLREASYGLGARKVTTSVRVVFPAAISGIVAALVIAVSRAIGETMVVAIAAGDRAARC